MIKKNLESKLSQEKFRAILEIKKLYRIYDNPNYINLYFKLIKSKIQKQYSELILKTT